MRRYVVLTVCFLAFFLFSSSHALAQFYRWVDNDGKEFFTNDPKQIPQQYQSSATEMKTDDRRVSVADKPIAPPRPSGFAGEHRDKNGRGEEYWHRKAENLRLKLREKQDEYDLVAKQINDQDQKPNRLNGKKKKSNSNLEKKKMKLEKEMAQTRRMLELDLPEEARKADAYPGWIRE